LRVAPTHLFLSFFLSLVSFLMSGVYYKSGGG
jgi:hypothetical protein